MAEKKNIDVDRIKELIEIMIANDLAEVEIINGDNKILLKRPQPQQPTVTPVSVITPNLTAAPPTELPEAKPAAPGEEEKLVDIKSPMVGTFYAAPSPDSEPYIRVGSDVTSETVVCIIEAMKVMNEIKAETTGTIAKILVANGQAVEYGQVLFKVKTH